MTWPTACTPLSVRPAQTTTTGSPATKDIAACTASWIDAECSCDCQPAYPVPSYSKMAATRRPPGPEALTLTGQSLDQALRFLFLTGGTFLHDFIEDAACSFRIAHVHVRPRQVQLGAHLAHGHRFQFRRREIVGIDLRGAAGRRDRLQLFGRRLPRVHRSAHVEIAAPPELTCPRHFPVEHVVFRP